jgi:hypothetical protein
LAIFTDDQWLVFIIPWSIIAPQINMKPSIAPKFNRKRSTTYLFSAKVREALLEKLDDVSLIKIVKSRRDGKTVKAKLEDI